MLSDRHRAMAATASGISKPNNIVGTPASAVSAVAKYVFAAPRSPSPSRGSRRRFVLSGRSRAARCDTSSTCHRIACAGCSTLQATRHFARGTRWSSSTDLVQSALRSAGARWQKRFARASASRVRTCNPRGCDVRIGCGWIRLAEIGAANKSSKPGFEACRRRWLRGVTRFDDPRPGDRERADVVVSLPGGGEIDQNPSAQRRELEAAPRGASKDRHVVITHQVVENHLAVVRHRIEAGLSVLKVGSDDLEMMYK